MLLEELVVAVAIETIVLAYLRVLVWLLKQMKMVQLVEVWIVEQE
jgi:hypothetical protein